MKVKQWFALVMVIGMLVVLGACGGGNSAQNGNSDTASNDPVAVLVGEWEYDGGLYSYVFSADGTGEYAGMAFTYEADGSVLSITYEGMDMATELEYSVDGKVLNVVDSFGDDTIYNKK